MDTRLQKLRDWAQSDLHESLLPWWTAHIMDGKGGFYGRVDAGGVPDPDADRYLVLSSRLVWTYSAAYRVTGRPEYRALAEQLCEVFVRWFHDDAHGGFYMAVDKDGRPALDYKFVYGNAFAVYALAEYARAIGGAGALSLAEDTARVMDGKIYDPVYRGYFETASRDWAWTPTVPGMNRGKDDQKTMNTHLHVIEAYTNLLRVSDDPRVRSRVRELLYTFLNTITNRDTHHFHVFQDRAWAPVTPEQSYGHDIEGSWLLAEAAEVLGEPQAIGDAAPVCVNIARAVYDDGFSECGALHTEYDPRSGEFSNGYTWWEQNEAVVGFLNAWQMTGEERFLDRAVSVMDFAKQYFVDREQGGWRAHVLRSLAPAQGIDKATRSICPYHNARMHLEIIERTDKLKQ
ncbi:MAG: AGE family epimerase/isomerase [Clostridiales bacterium]|jgi:mannobiose 2-epimerase|nr:AGE family epimerase/isomerase [Clostridiales bacterium]